MPLGLRAPAQTGTNSRAGVIFNAQPRHGTSDLPRLPQKPTFSVTHALPSRSNFGPNANSW